MGVVSLPYALPAPAGEAGAAEAGESAGAAGVQAPPRATSGLRAMPGLRGLLGRLRARVPLGRAPHGRGASCAWRALFSEDFLPPHSPSRIARWAARHGSLQAPPAEGLPLRQVALDAALVREGESVGERHLLTAAIEVGEQRLRLLLAPTPAGAILGGRCWSRPRAAVAAAAMFVLVLLPPAWLALGQGEPAAPVLAAAAASASATSSAASAAASASDAVDSGAATAAAPAIVDATAATAASVEAAARAVDTTPSAPSAAAPPAASPRRGRIEMPRLVQRLDEDERKALRASARSLRGPPPEPPAWALATPPLARRSAERAAAQLQAVALLRGQPMRVEQWPVGARWRAVSFAYASAAEARKVRQALADKGLQTELIEF